MIKNIAIVILVILLVIAGVEYAFRPQPKNDSLTVLSKLRAENRELASHDSLLMHRDKLFRDSLKTERATTSYWRARYIAPVKVTKRDIQQVFSQDSTTIAKEVVKGSICDSLQASQSIEIKTLTNHAMNLDSTLAVRMRTIKNFVKIDSTHVVAEKDLNKKVKRRTIGEIALGVLSLLLLLSGHR